MLTSIRLFKTQFTSLAIAVSMGLSSQMALAQSTQGNQNSDDGNIDDDVEVIMIKGVRNSLKEALLEKRFADDFRDVIKAEDIGEMPDASIADSLSRITGVQVVRDAGTSLENTTGQQVSIRGLPSLTIVNGRTALSGQLDRNVDFRVFASEAFSQVAASKSPTANQIEGGLGGTIELETRNSLELDERVVSLTTEIVYLDYPGTTNPKVVGLYADKFFDDKLGILISGSYRKQETLLDQYYNRSGYRVLSNIDADTGFDFDNDGENDDILSPNNPRLNHGVDNQTRTGLEVSLVYQPTEELTFKFDATNATFDRDYQNGVFAAAGLSSVSRLDYDSVVLDDTGTLVKGTWLNAVPQVDGRYQIRNTESKNYGFNVEWKGSDYVIEFDISDATGFGDFDRSIIRTRALNNADITYDATVPGYIPDIIVNQVGTTTPFDFNDRDSLRADLTLRNRGVFDNTEQSSRFDFTYFLDGAFSAIKTGVRWAETNYFRTNWSNESVVNDASNDLFFDLSTDTTSDRLSVAVPALDPILVEGYFPNSGGVFAGRDGNFPRTWLYAQYPGLGVDDTGVLGTILGNGWDQDVRTDENETPSTFADITEETLAAYIRGDFDFGDYISGNVGLRFVNTDITSTALQETRLSTGTVTSLVTATHDYNNVLPSLNLTAELQEDLLLRFGAGTVIRRPNVGSLRNRTTLSLSSFTGTAGNVQLDPFEADQFDISLEWYFSDEGALTGGLFYKDVKNFIGSETTFLSLEDANIDPSDIPDDELNEGGDQFTITRPINAGGAKIQGFEIGFQQPFTNAEGFFSKTGIVTNYTYIDADREDGERYENLSRHFANLILYYDDGQFDTRIAYNYRSNFRSAGDGGNILLGQGVDIYEIVDDSFSLDLSARYRVNDIVTLRFQALNLTEEPYLRYVGNESRVRDYREQGRTYSFNVKATF